MTLRDTKGQVHPDIFAQKYLNTCWRWHWANCLFFEHYLVAYNLEIKDDRKALPPVNRQFAINGG